MEITAYDHVGIRVTDRSRALAFYAALGFSPDESCSDARVAEVVNSQQVRLSLIFNGVSHPSGANIQMDQAVKWPGVTHAAFVVRSLQEVLRRLAVMGCPITEGPVDWGRRLTCFVRDPDGNVLEFNELLTRPAPEKPGSRPGVGLVIGSKNYSSWSMRAWLLLRWLGVPFEEIPVPLYEPGSTEILLRYSPSAKAPVLIDGPLTIWDTMAIIDHLAETHPQVWPHDPERRAYARSVCAEKHAGFQALRAAMSYNARGRDRRVAMTPELAADIWRIKQIWSDARRRFGAGGPWLLGDFGICDIMFAPTAVRFVTYGVALDADLAAYHGALLAHPLVAEWLEAGRDDPPIAACEVGA